MDHMDIDNTIDVPDTPDRLAARRIRGRNGVKEENPFSPMLCRSGQQKFFKEGTKDQPMVIDSGSRGLSLRPPKCTSNSLDSRHPINSPAFSLGDSSSSRSTHLFRKGMTEKNPSYLSHDSVHAPHPWSDRPPYMSRSSSSSSQDDGFVDLTEKNLHRPVIENAYPSGLPGNNQAEFQRRSGLANGTSSLHGLTNFSTASRNASEEMENVTGVGSRNDFGKGVEFVGNIPNNPGNGGFLSHNPVASPKVTKQKRLVRNGCISPNNIAKAKQLAEKDMNDYSVAVTHNNNGFIESDVPPSSIDIRELVAEDSDAHRRKGKGVISHPCLSKEPDFRSKNMHSRGSITSYEKATETSNCISTAGKSIQESGGWINVRNRTGEMKLSSAGKERFLISETDASRCSSQDHEESLGRRDKGISIATGDDYPKDSNVFSSQRVHTQPSRESVSHPRARLGRFNGPRSAAGTLIKRQKQGSTSRRGGGGGGECSTSAADDPDVMFLSSPAEAANPRSISGSTKNLHQIIEVDDSPQLRRDTHDEDARARQVEADELLARELQEQLYNELPAFGFGEIDEHITVGLQHQGHPNRGVSRARHPALDSRGSLSSLHGQYQSRSSSNAPRRGSLARASTLGRMTRLRNRFPGQPRSLLPSRGSTSIFPADMDVDMRMHILGALEEFNDMAVSAGILQTQRDFNENDYEMLLALDDNNDHHSGASIHQINSLPQTTVQNDNFGEACAICLDTPTVGDTIRHLPCLHKFHKDCIDPWLRRKTSCPVCKSSIA
ncbi:hypothetical protein CDL12_10573 [Handroanthus impetiginosus]|uniref:RING-type domain-containing protein n=1 Tax=Handroanthus impetiginosus TaxID=429701 RepID=A0A2G9HGV7_9LAMI|nr:hypothetical protein CDL12_10573 [Handroanthus impetiginosus]